MEQMNDQSGRMPRACKRPRPNEMKSVKTPGQSRAASLAELLQQQDNRRYSAEPVPDISIHYSSSGSAPTSMQPPSVSYGRLNKRCRTEAVDLTNNVLQNQQRGGYPPVSQEQPQLYSRTTRSMAQTNNVSQILYPNMMQAPTPPYSVQEQYSVPEQPAPVPEQGTGYRYNTRRSVHNLNLPLSTAPDPMANYWSANDDPNPNNPSTPSETQSLPRQVKPRAPMKRQSRPELKDMWSQTDLSLTDEITKFIKKLLEKCIDTKKFDVITENGVNIITYLEDESELNQARIETINSLTRVSQHIKISFLAKFCALACQGNMNGLPTGNLALMYPSSENSDTNNNNENGSSAALNQQNFPAMLQQLINTATQEANAILNPPSSDSEEASPPPQPQVPQFRGMRRPNQGFQIPTMEQWNNFRRHQQQAYRYPVRSQMQPGFNMPNHFMRNFQYNHHNANYYPQFHPAEQYRMNGWF